ncbi:Maf family protein [Methylocella sp.]|uniref:Maf family protein n=1 Tax=Methylocella sp. TaxID=1978226 RepID=UPI003783F1FE
MSSALWLGADPLVLASRSAARAALLAAAGLPFEARAADIDERAVEAPLVAAGAGASGVARALAKTKALAVSAAAPGRLVVGADQTLACDGRLFVKPESRAAAAAALAALSGRAHELHSALCAARDGQVLFAAAPVARLHMRALSSKFIDAYLDAAGPAVLGSVGAYQIEGAGMHLFERIEGDHSTILGLPLLPLFGFLRDEGLILS